MYFFKIEEKKKEAEEKKKKEEEEAKKPENNPDKEPGVEDAMDDLPAGGDHGLP